MPKQRIWSLLVNENLSRVYINRQTLQSLPQFDTDVGPSQHQGQETGGGLDKTRARGQDPRRRRGCPLTSCYGACSWGQNPRKIVLQAR